MPTIPGNWDGTTTNRLVPTTPVGTDSISTSLVTAGYAHTCGLVRGLLMCWGSNQSGQLGDGTLTNRLTPVRVSGFPLGVPLAAHSTSAGAAHTCTITSQSAVMCWGDNSWGQLGNGTRVNSSVPVRVVGIPEGAISIAAGEQHSCAVTTAGALKCWGSNFDQQIVGAADFSQFLFPTPITVYNLERNVVAVTAGARHTCAITTAGALICLGRNTSGELGNGSFVIGIVPKPVLGFESGTLSMEGAETHSCAVVAEPSTLKRRTKCWGNNANFKLGFFFDLTTPNFPQPYNVVGLPTTITDVAGGHAHSCAIDSVRQVSCWGNNDQGQLGNGTTNSQIFARPIAQ